MTAKGEPKNNFKYRTYFKRCSDVVVICIVSPVTRCSTTLASNVTTCTAHSCFKILPHTWLAYIPRNNQQERGKYNLKSCFIKYLEKPKTLTSVFFREARATQALESKKSPARTANCTVWNRWSQGIYDQEFIIKLRKHKHVKIHI